LKVGANGMMTNVQNGNPQTTGIYKKKKKTQQE
jgi:hypothetical protein